ncbi:hypothetical protein, partial [Pantoea sp. GbtcB22]|uniref:hypothetical protein n=1 Tax=Pantoea sp. GbtcB22 TaxID=2824767 RepID=UPI001C30E7A1
YLPLFAAVFIFAPPLFILHFPLYCQILDVLYATSAKPHSRNMHNSSQKGFFMLRSGEGGAGGYSCGAA